MIYAQTESILKKKKNSKKKTKKNKANKIL